MSKSLDIKIRETKDLGAHQLASANRHGLDHDCASYGLWTRLDVTTACEFQPKAHFSQKWREVGHTARSLGVCLVRR